MAETFFLASILTIQTAVCLTGGQAFDCSDKRDGGLHPDPKDCSRFYNCFIGNAYHYVCPPGLLFNANVDVCDWPFNVICQKQSIENLDSDTTLQITKKSTTTTSTTTVAPTSTSSTTTTHTTSSSHSALFVNTTTPMKAAQPTNPPSDNFCFFKPDDLYADPDRCASFYQCNNGNTYHFTCQEDLHFNTKFKYCDWKRNVNCSESREKPQRNESVSNQVDNEPKFPVVPPNVTNSSAAACGNVVCYFPNWALYRKGFGVSFGPEHVNPDLCTHIIYAFAHVRGNRLVAFEAGDEPRGGDIGNFARITNLKLRNPKLKVLLGVGGWNMGTIAFSSMAASQGNRTEFINSTIGFLRSNNFDGIDLDWEYPNNGENAAVNVERYTLLVEELRASFDKEDTGDKRLLLTGAVAAGKYTIDTSYDVPRISAAFDLIHLMTYDLHGTWDGKTGHHSPLKAGSWETNEQRYFNIEWVANYWVSLGAPKHKLAIGIPLYARTFTLQSTSQTEVGAPISGPGIPGKFTQESGSLSYYEVCSMRNQSAQYEIHEQKVPYLVAGDQWVGYDSPASIREKVQFILEQGFGGIMVWELSMDDFSGRFCGEGSYPLVSAIVSQCALSAAN